MSPKSARDGIVVVTQDDATAKSVTAALAADEMQPAPVVCRDLDEMLALLDASPARAALIDVDPGPEMLLAGLGRLASRYPQTKFIVLARELKNTWLLQAMQAGARHFLAKGDVESELLEVITRLCPPDPASDGRFGSVVTILSAGGGCGATTLAINLAEELYRRSGDRALLVDLDGFAGGIAGHLGTRAMYSVADVLTGADRLDAHLIRSSSVMINEGLSLLASPATVDVEHPRPLELRQVGRVLQRARETFRHVVVDAPRIDPDGAESLARASAQTFVLFEMNVEHIRVAKAMLASLARRGVPRERVLPIANRFPSRRDAISIEEATRALGVSRIGRLSNDWNSVVMSINYGKPLADVAPRSDVRRDIQKLAMALDELLSRGSAA